MSAELGMNQSNQAYAVLRISSVLNPPLVDVTSMVILYFVPAGGRSLGEKLTRISRPNIRLLGGTGMVEKSS